MRAVIFDLDGVLVRTDQAHDKACFNVVADFSIFQ